MSVTDEEEGGFDCVCFHWRVVQALLHCCMYGDHALGTLLLAHSHCEADMACSGAQENFG